MMFVASTERLFYKKFNKYYDFKHNEILSILEQEIKIFENILNEIKLDYILCTPIVRHYQYLFYLICKTQSTKFLMFEPIRFGDRYMISEELFLNAAKTIDFRQMQFQEKTKDEIINFLEYYKPRKFELNNVKEISEKFKIKPKEKIKAMIQFPFVKNEYNNSFATLGRTKRNILFKGRGSEYKKQKKERKIT